MGESTNYQIDWIEEILYNFWALVGVKSAYIVATMGYIYLFKHSTDVNLSSVLSY